VKKKTAHTITLNNALEVVGDRGLLAAALGIAPSDLEAYLSGERPMPDQVFLDALDVVAGAPRT
jgi:DNA-binding transcriptional regulator YdaS (Cro superfamily)